MKVPDNYGPLHELWSPKETTTSNSTRRNLNSGINSGAPLKIFTDKSI